jgi:type II secretory pathway component PulK
MLQSCRISRTGRNGATLVAVLVCLIVITALGAALLRTIVRRHRQMRQQQTQLQAIWLAQSALDRAVVQLHASPDYTGETWRVAAEQIGGDKTGAATIRIEAVEGQSAQRRVLIEAIYPDDPQYRVRETKELIVTLPDKGDVR